MTHYFEKTIVDAKTIYTDYLLNILTPILYYGIKTIYDEAKDMEQQIKETARISPDVKNPGVLQLFQLYLSGLDQWTDSMMEQEANRIRSTSGCADIFDDLVRAVIKSHIIVLTYTASEKTCKIVKERLYEKVQIKSFIHCCYLECAKIFFDHPTLFFHEFPSIELKENERKIYQLIKIGIKTGIKRVLPMKQILETYLGNDYIEIHESEEDKYTKLKTLINKDLYEKEKSDNENNYFNDNDEGGIRQLIDDYETPAGYELDKIESLIFGNNRIIGDTIDENIDNENIKNDNLTLLQQTKSPHLSPNLKINKIANNDNIDNVDNNNVEQIKPDSNEEIKIIKSEHKSINKSANKSEEQNQQNIFDDYFKKHSRSKKKSSNVIEDAMKSIKNTHNESDIKIDRNTNDNYFEG